MWRDKYRKGQTVELPPAPEEGKAEGGGSPAGGASVHVAGESLLTILTQERERTGALVAQWLDQQREQASQQERLLQGLLEAQRRTIQDLRSDLGIVGDATGGAPSKVHFNPRVEKTASPSQNKGDDGPIRESTAGPAAEEAEERRAAEAAAALEAEGKAGGLEAEAEQPRCLESEVEELQKCENVMHWWKRASGLQTVAKWVSNYHKHPAGWGALLMVQGIPEVTGRLRSKVENYAIYSALFLSMSFGLLAEKPELVDTECLEDDYAGIAWWVCHLRYRLYFYGFGVGTAAHMLSIMLAMSFVNALNEAARDSDVYRMFARGQGYYATVRCQYAFRVGCVADLLAVVTASSYHIGWEAVVGTAVCAVYTLVQASRTAKLLFSNASIVDYWREDRGGKPDKDDPYDLQVPVGVFKETLRLNNKFFTSKVDGTGSTDSALWGPLQRAMRDGDVKGAARKGPANQAQGAQAGSAAVAAIF